MSCQLPTFWYLSPAPVSLDGPVDSTSSAPSPPKDSLATLASGLEPAFLAGAFLGFVALGGVLDMTESPKLSSSSDGSSSESAFAFFFVAFAAGLALRVVCVVFFAFGAAGFLALAF